MTKPTACDGEIMMDIGLVRGMRGGYSPDGSVS